MPSGALKMVGSRVFSRYSNRVTPIGPSALTVRPERVVRQPGLDLRRPGDDERLTERIQFDDAMIPERVGDFDSSSVGVGAASS